MKPQVLQAIGETDLVRPSQVNAALAANDRLKYYFSLLQIAVGHADHPELPANTLRRERLACGIDDSRLDDVVAAARRDGERYHIPGCARVLEQIARDLRVMAEPVLGPRLRPTQMARSAPGWSAPSRCLHLLAMRGWMRMLFPKSPGPGMA